MNMTPDETRSDEGVPEFHPSFCAPGGDIILSAKNETYFRCHSYTLKNTSGWFNAMLSLPQAPGPPSEASVETIVLQEDTETLEHLLRMACGLPILPVTDFDLVDKILFAAEKYDMPGPMSILRLLVMTPALANQPFRLYTVACRYNWEDEARSASTQTLTHYLHDPLLRPALERLSTGALLKLFDLHNSRKVLLRERLNKTPFVASDPMHVTSCGHCQSTIDYHTWRELKARIIHEIEMRPLGDTIIDNGLSEWPEAKACWAARCSNRAIQCGRHLYDQEPTVRIIRESIEELPKSI